MPSKYTLMSISEKPFFVLMLEDIELVSIERIDNKIKNFDMIIIFKDYKRPVVNIDNIPKIDVVEQMKGLAKLKEDGIINDEEFELMKAKVMKAANEEA